MGATTRRETEQHVGLRLRLAQESLTDPMRRRFAAAALVLILVLAFLAVRQVQSQQPQGVLGSQKLAYPSLESQLSDLVERGGGSAGDGTHAGRGSAPF